MQTANPGTDQRTPESKYREIFNAIDEGINLIELIYDESGKVVDCLFLEVNQASERITGLNHVAGKYLSEIAPNSEQSWLDTYDQIAKTGEPRRFEAFHAFTKRWYSSFAFRIGKPGQHRVAILFTDITKRKQAEANQAFLFHLVDTLRSLQDPFSVQETVMRLLGEHIEASRVVYLDMLEDGDSFAAIHGYYNKLAAMPDGMRLSDFGEAVLAGFRAAQTLTVFDSDTHPTFGPAEHAAYAAINIKAGVGVPLVKNNQLVAILSVQQVIPRHWTEDEITLIEAVAERTWAAVERVKTEQALRNSEQELKRMLKTREEFIGIASHELKTPVTSIRVFGDLVEEQLAAKGEQELAGIVCKLNVQIDRLTLLIGDLLDTSRFEESRMVYNKQRIDLNALITERLEELQRTAPRRKIIQDTHDALWVYGDPERIAQVIVNIISNAMKYSPEETNITVRSCRGDDEATVSVIDQGVGIPAASLGRIFDRFYRVGGQRMSTYPGLGLGLYIAAEIIKNHNGRIAVTSEEGNGSAFTISLPLQITGS